MALKWRQTAWKCLTGRIITHCSCKWTPILLKVRDIRLREHIVTHLRGPIYSALLCNSAYQQHKSLAVIMWRWTFWRSEFLTFQLQSSFPSIVTMIDESSPKVISRGETIVFSFLKFWHAKLSSDKWSSNILFSKRRDCVELSFFPETELWYLNKAVNSHFV